MEESKEPKYVSMRVPKAEYDKLRRVREELQQNPDYSWVGSLALGAFVGLVAGLPIISKHYIKFNLFINHVNSIYLLSKL